MRIARSDENQWHLDPFETLYLRDPNAIRLTKGDDTYHASDAGEHVLGLRGNDSIFGGAGDDILQGGIGNDFLYGEDAGGRSRDTLYGGEGNDNVEGGGGNDHLFGGDGDDQLLGGRGADVLEGGAGRDQIDLGRASHGFDSDGMRDIVVYTSIDEGGDTLINFQAGEDRIDLSQIDANSTTPENDAFHFINQRAFSGTPGELRFVSDGSFTYVLADTNGDGQADFQVTITTVSDLHARDFIF